jgi:hypothetical protein
MMNHIASAVLALMLTGPLAAAQTGDWQVVENLPQRSLISVEDMHHVIHDTCRFQSVSDGQLFCEYGSGFSGPSEIAFRRESVRAVRQEHNSTLIGLAIGAGAGAVFGAARDTTPGIGRGGSALVGAGVYGGVGALVGSAHGHFSHGKVIYQNPNDQPRNDQARTDGPSQTDDAESQGLEPGNDIAAADRIAAARRPYTPPEDVSAGTNARVTLAQLPRRRPGPPFSPGLGYPPPTYPRMWMGEHSGRHAAIGALIGLGIGVAVCVKGNAGVRASLAIGAVGAGIGAAIGSSIPSFPSRNMYRRGWPDDDEEALRSKPDLSKPDLKKADSTKKDAARPPATVQPDLSQSIARAQDPPPLAVNGP